MDVRLRPRKKCSAVGRSRVPPGSDCLRWEEHFAKALADLSAPHVLSVPKLGPIGIGFQCCQFCAVCILDKEWPRM